MSFVGFDVGVPPASARHPARRGRGRASGSAVTGRGRTLSGRRASRIAWGRLRPSCESPLAATSDLACPDKVLVPNHRLDEVTATGASAGISGQRPHDCRDVAGSPASAGDDVLLMVGSGCAVGQLEIEVPPDHHGYGLVTLYISRLSPLWRSCYLPEPPSPSALNMVGVSARVDEQLRIGPRRMRAGHRGFADRLTKLEIRPVAAVRDRALQGGEDRAWARHRRTRAVREADLLLGV